MHVLQAKLDREFLAKEEEAEEKQADYEKTIKDKTKLISQLSYELKQVQEKSGMLQKKIEIFEENSGKDAKDFETSIRRQQEFWNEQKRTLDGIMFNLQTRNE